MAPLSIAEIQNLAVSLESYVHCRLQKIESGQNGATDWLAFHFYGHGADKPLFLSLAPKCPVLLPIGIPVGYKRKTIPALLFLRAHFDSHILKSVAHDPTEGRVLRLGFSNGGELEIRLFPHGQNLVARIDGKKLSTHKVSELRLAPATSSADSKPLRSIEDLISEFEGSQSPQGAAPGKVTIDQQLKKKERALELVEKDIAEKRSAPYREAGEWLKAHQTLEMPAEFAGTVDASLSFAENLNLVFAKAKQNEEKLKNAAARAEALRTEIAALKSGEAPAVPPKQSALKTAGAKGRTVELKNGSLVYFGKSGEENIKLLRGAQPWDYWLHVKDIPGSHGIIRRNKNEKIADGVLIEALGHLLRHQFGQRARDHAGEKFSCLVAECRYVKPIKGDRIGRVTYQNERVITLKFSVD